MILTLPILSRRTCCQCSFFLLLSFFFGVCDDVAVLLGDVGESGYIRV